MWGHMLSMSVVVLSHIMSIYQSSALPLMMPSTSGLIEVDLSPLSSSSYDGNSREESNQKERNDLIQTAILLGGGGNDAGEETLVQNFKRGIRHRYEFAPWIVPGGTGNGKFVDTTENENSMDGGSVGDNWMKPKTRRAPASASISNSDPVAQIEEEMMTYPVPNFIRNRNVKRSPRCLRRCLAQGLLHPSQCHSLC